MNEDNERQSHLSLDEMTTTTKSWISVKNDLKLVCCLIVVGLLTGANIQINRIIQCIRDEAEKQHVCKMLPVSPGLQAEICSHSISFKSPNCFLASAPRISFQNWFGSCLYSGNCNKRPSIGNLTSQCDQLSTFADFFLYVSKTIKQFT